MNYELPTTPAPSQIGHCRYLLWGTKNAPHFSPFFSIFLHFSQKRTYFSPFFFIFLYFSPFFSIFFLPILPNHYNHTPKTSFLPQKPTSHFKINPKNRCFFKIPDIFSFQFVQTCADCRKLLTDTAWFYIISLYLCENIQIQT